MKLKSYVIETIQLAWPAIMESFFVALTGLIDSFMVSRLGTDAVAAVGLTTQPKFICLTLFTSANVAVSAMVARKKGSQKRNEANQILLISVIFTLVAGVLISMAAVVFADPIIRLSGSGSETHQMAVNYFRIITGGMFFNILSLVINAAQRGVGNTKIAMKTNIVSNLINIIFNYFLIYGKCGFPQMGVEGAALATVLGTVVASIMSIFSIWPLDNYINIRFIIKDKTRIVVENIRIMLRMLISIFSEMILIRLGLMALAVLAAGMGTDAFAVHQVGMNVMTITFSFGDGMQAASIALVGRSLGENDVKKARMYGKICHYIGYVISFTLAVIYFLGGEWFFGLYFEEAQNISLGTQISRLIVIIAFLQISQLIYSGSLRVAGDVYYVIIVALVSVVLLRPLVAYFFGYVLDWGMIGIWMGVFADQLSRYIFTKIRFDSGKWEKIKL